LFFATLLTVVLGARPGGRPLKGRGRLLGGGIMPSKREEITQFESALPLVVVRKKRTLRKELL